MVTERENLHRALTGARQHVLDQLDGLDEEALRRPVLPSGWAALGLVRHLTLSDERYWFEVVVAGGPLDWWPEGDDGDWQVSPDEPAVEVVADYRAAIDAADRILARHALDASPAGREPDWPDDRFPDVRSVVQHVIVETATHAGQLDAVRELLDGRQHLVL
ncbi:MULTISPECIES: DinB family protein [unclassified Knoellia]|uniref:DinB family protein n=1 Tax=Knoellia altitudinis TaxID=3404795 RepID=UPI00362119FA